MIPNLILSGLLAIGLALGHSDTAHGETKQVRAWLDAPRQTFKEFERFSVYLFVTNIGSDSLCVPFASEELPQSLELHMTSSSGDELRRTVLSDPIGGDSVSLAPGDTVMFQITPLESFYSGGWKEYSQIYIPVGIYELAGIYWEDYPLQPLAIEIERLTPAEEKIADEFHATACRFSHGIERLEDFESLLDRYDDTFLGTRIAFYVLGIGAGVKAPDKIRVQDATEILEKFPARGVVSGALACLYVLLDDTTLVKTLRAHPEVLSDKYGRFMIRETSNRYQKPAILEEVMAD